MASAHLQKASTTQNDLKAVGAGGVRQRQSLEARHKLIEATIFCLDNFGYADTSIARIQDQANVSRGALTHHFPSKEELVIATIDSLLEKLLRPSLPSKKLSQTDIVADLRWLARNMTGTARGAPVGSTDGLPHGQKTKCPHQHTINRLEHKAGRGSGRLLCLTQWR